MLKSFIISCFLLTLFFIPGCEMTPVVTVLVENQTNEELTIYFVRVDSQGEQTISNRGTVSTGQNLKTTWDTNKGVLTLRAVNTHGAIVLSESYTSENMSKIDSATHKMAILP